MCVPPPSVGLSLASVRVLTCCVRLGKRRYNIKLWKTFTDCFNCLPIAAIIDEKIFTMHGGLSPDLQSMEQIRRVMRPTDVPDTGQRLPFQPLHLYWVRLADAVYIFLRQACCATCCGQTQTKISQAGQRTIVVSRLRLAQMSSHGSYKNMIWI